MSEPAFVALEWPLMAHGAGKIETDNRKRLNVRSGPVDGEILGLLAYGERVTVWAALTNGWYLVQAAATGLTGYVLADYVKLDAPLVH